MSRQLKLLSLIILAVVVASVGYSIYSGVMKSQKTSTFRILTTPTGTIVKLNGKGIKAGTIKVKPGQYTLTASKDGFTTASATANIKPQEIRFMGLALTPSSPATQNWYDTHPQDAVLGDGIGSGTDDQKAKDVAAGDKLLAQLPIDISPLFIITEGKSVKYPNDKTKTALYVASPDPSGNNDALTYIYGQGFDPSDYEIIFSNTVKQNGPGE